MWRFVLLFLIIIVAYVKSRFWLRQPVRHCFNFFQPNGLQTFQAPKHVNHARVQSFETERCDNKNQIKSAAEYVQTQHNDVYFPDLRHILAYFHGSFISTYKAETIKGCIVSRPIRLKVDQQYFNAHYQEVMASETDHISRELITTHENNRRKRFQNSPSVFATDSPVPFALPTTRYEIRWIQTKLFEKSQTNFRMVKASEKNLDEIIHYWKESRFTFQVVPTIHQLVEWLKTNIATVYYVFSQETIVAMFFFKNTLMVDHNKSIIDCCGIIKSRISREKEKQTEKEIEKVFGNLMCKIKKVNSIVRIHMNSHAFHWLPPCYRKTQNYVYLYGYLGPVNVPPDSCFVF